MKTSLPLFSRSFAALALLTISCFSCKKSDKPEQPPVETGLVTPVGTPQGTATSKSITNTGGVIETADGQLKIEIPPGAVATEQTISIQPITTTNSAGLGQAYRLTPHDFVFSKPVKITFAYTDNQIKTTIPEALGIAYQNKQGVWMAVGGSELNKTNKKISVTTTHFSDWGFFERVNITPQSSTVLPNGMIKLNLSRTLPYADLLAPLVPGKEYPIVDKVPLEKEFIKQWRPVTEGQLTPNNNEATYKAPAQEPETNPVVVTTELKLPGIADQLLLSAFITVASEGIKFRINGGPWIKTDEGIGQYFRTCGCTQVSGYIRENGVYKGHVEINWHGKSGSFSWDMMGGNTFLYSVPGSSLNTLYEENYRVGNGWANSPGSLVVTKYGEVQTNDPDSVPGYISGSFVLEKIRNMG
jgi:hypothetical protein